MCGGAERQNRARTPVSHLFLALRLEQYGSHHRVAVLEIPSERKDHAHGIANSRTQSDIAGSSGTANDTAISERRDRMTSEPISPEPFMAVVRERPSSKWRVMFLPPGRKGSRHAFVDQNPTAMDKAISRDCPGCSPSRRGLRRCRPAPAAVTAEYGRPPPHPPPPPPPPPTPQKLRRNMKIP